MQFAQIVNIVWNVPLTSSDCAYGFFNSYQIVMYQCYFEKIHFFEVNICSVMAFHEKRQTLTEMQTVKIVCEI